jgi:hypothetical protein
LAKPHRQTKALAMSPGLLQASSLARQPAPFGANCPGIQRVLFQANSRVQMADWRRPLLGLPVTAKLFAYPAGSRSPLPVPKVLQPDCRLRPATGILRARVRARQCLRGPGPFAFFREIPADRKCNRAARCGDYPISVRYRRRCSRRGLVGYGNRRSRLLRKRARPGRTFPIAGADKCPSPLRRIQD